MALIEGLKSLRHLKEIDFSSSCRIEADAARLLAQGLLECQFAGELEVFVGIRFGSKKLLNELRSLQGTGRVVHERFWSRLALFLLGRLRGNLGGAHFTIKATAGVEEASKLGWLRRQLAKFSSCKKRATNSPQYSPRVNPDAHVVAHV